LSPLRILVIVLLLYIGYRLIAGGRKKDSGEQPGNSFTGKDRKPDGPVQDILVEDPVCHSLVPKKQAVRLKHRGSVVYFCSEECCNAFLARQEAEE